MGDSGMVTIIVAVISAIGAIGASVAGVVATRLNRDQKQFRLENTDQHGQTMSLIKEIQSTTRETRQDVRDIRADLRDLTSEFEHHVVAGADAHKTRATPTKDKKRDVNPKKESQPARTRRRAS